MIAYIAIGRILANQEFLSTEVRKVNILFRHLVLLPELLGNLFTRGKPVSSSTVNDTQDKWCYCENGDDATLIRCKETDCTIKQSHEKCTGLKRVPKLVV